MITETLNELPLVSAELNAQILSSPRTTEAHRDLFEQTDAMHFVQSGGEASSEALPSPLTIAAWNVERCLFPKETADKLRAEGADIVLLSEADHGMARTGQRHTTEEVAAHLGMAYIYGVEFFELGLGSPPIHSLPRHRRPSPFKKTAHRSGSQLATRTVMNLRYRMAATFRLHRSGRVRQRSSN